MQRRDEALKSTEDGLKKQFEQQLEIENEIQGYKGSINAEKEKHEELTSILIKHENEKSYIEKQQDELDDVLAKKQQQYLNYKATLEQTDLQIKKAENEAKVVRNEMSGIDQRIIKLSNEMRGLEDSMLHVLSEQTTFKRDYQTTLLEIEKKRNQIRDLQVETSQEENELARMTIDKLQSEDHNKQLSQILAQLEDDLKKKDTLLEKYESEIRKKHDEIERKQAYEDKLNRQYDKLLASQQEENYGPLEATIHNLQKAIEAKIRENEQLKKDWTRYQNELVTLVNKSDELNGDLQKIRAKQTILTQKKNRLDGDTIKEREVIAEMSTSMRHMHSEMVKLNSTISENGKLEKTLADTNFDMENKILASLQEREREALKLEDTIRDLREKKRDLLDELLEVERAIRYWSKKIELQKEIQEAVDPEVGQEEITRMKKEIHIMEQRLIILKRNARAKVEDMERAILKRAIILDKGNAATKNAKNKSSNIKANVQREVSQLNKELTTRKTESTKTLALIKKFQDEAMQTGERIDQTRAEAEEIKQQMNFLTADIQKLQLSKMRAVMEKDMVSKINEKCQAIVKGKKYNMSVKANDVEAIDRELQKQLAKRDGIIKAVEYIRKEFETYSEQLEVVVEALN
jgi:chromosome segregation ATPase